MVVLSSRLFCEFSNLRRKSATIRNDLHSDKRYCQTDRIMNVFGLWIMISCSKLSAEMSHVSCYAIDFAAIDR